MRRLLLTGLLALVPTALAVPLTPDGEGAFVGRDANYTYGVVLRKNAPITDAFLTLGQKPNDSNTVFCFKMYNLGVDGDQLVYRLRKFTASPRPVVVRGVKGTKPGEVPVAALASCLDVDVRNVEFDVTVRVPRSAPLALPIPLGEYGLSATLDAHLRLAPTLAPLP
ncbi:hypothetical protein QOL99_00150 [Deinococcus sp. MIMF12]|uniref:Uncharacterized protein n=1 Tax=Deinococcus rhizophilus TaxID=3049544 RepID=A0ABT7JFU2_9DEIO|nr:hypothetical protein [Deinococcus rhizophilus]MDL2342559.1 hypothetical protein [Deinococcus rhizophilus]